jgi:Ca2+-binding RTX toxin-like protein
MSTNIYVAKTPSVVSSVGDTLDSLAYQTGNFQTNGAEDLMVGDVGNDTLKGNKGNDLLIGNGGKDVLEGGDGDDTLAGGAGIDRLLGGAGTDTYVFRAGDGEDTIEDSDGLGAIKVAGTTLVGAAQTEYLMNGQWSVNSGEIVYTLDETNKRLVISGTALGADNSITINKVDVAKLTGTDGYLGIKLDRTFMTALVQGSGTNVFGVSGFNPSSLAGQQSNITEGCAKTFTICLNQPAKANETITLALTSLAAQFKVILGDSVVAADGAVITLAEGQTQVSFALVQEGDVTADASTSISATYAGAEGSVTSNAWGVNLHDAGPISKTKNGDQHPVVDNVFQTYPWITTSWAADGTLSGGVTEANFSDVLNGTAGNDKLSGLGGNDALSGGAGNDEIDGGMGDDLIGGGTGSDRILGGIGDDYITSSATLHVAQRYSLSDSWHPPGTQQVLTQGALWGIYKDTLPDGSSVTIWDGPDSPMGQDADVVDAGAGDDWVIASGGDDRVQGGLGDDQLDGMGGNDVLEGGDGKDVIGGDGLIKAGFANTLAAQYHGADFLDGGAGDDNLVGGGSNDVVYGGLDNDRMWGDGYDKASDADYLDPTYQGNDYLDGEDGNDYMDGGGKDDTLYGGAGDDDMWGDPSASNVDTPAANALVWGNDYLDGEDGADKLTGGGKDDTLYGGAGNDQLWGDENNSALAAEYHGSDYLDGEDGDDFLEGGGKDDTLYGGAGQDNMWGDTSASNVTTPQANALIWGNDYMDGEGGDDKLVGGGKDDTLYGGAGNDELWGDESNVALAADYQGSDYLDGEDGDDYLEGGGKNDTLYGGDGNDQLLGDAASQTLAGQFHGDDYLDGEGGNDTLFGYGGADALYGGAGSDFLSGDAEVTALALSFHGDDYLDGGEGDDTLLGNGGNDTLISAQGIDFLNGGEGDDTYVISNGSGVVDAPDAVGTGITDTAGRNTLIINGAATVNAGVLNRDRGKLIFNVDGRKLVVVGGLTGTIQTINVNGQETSMQRYVAENVQQTVRIDLDRSSNNMNLWGGTQTDYLNSIGQANSVAGGRGDDIIILSGSSNTIVFNKGDGADSVDTYAPEVPWDIQNTVVLGEGIQQADVQLAVDATGALVISFAGVSTDRITVSRTEDYIGNLGVSKIRLADGSEMDVVETLAAQGTIVDRTFHGGPGADVLVGGAGNDILWGGDDTDVLDGGAGNDKLYGESGSDTYKFGLGSGKDTIDNYSNDVHGSQPDTVQLGVGLTTANVRFERSVLDLRILLTDSTDELKVYNYFSNSGTSNYAVNFVRFADGTSLDVNAIKTLVLTGTAGNDDLQGFDSDDTLTGLAGDDRIWGGAGADILLGGDGADTLSGDDGDDTLDGGAGNDQLFGGNGTNTYRFGIGGGLDVVDCRGPGLNDVVRLGAGVTTPFVTLSHTDRDVVLHIANSNDELTLSNFFIGTPPTIIFEDGAVWTADNIKTLLLSGTAGNDSITGFVSNDHIDGLAGDDYVYGMAGNDELIGGVGNDRIFGGDGGDTLYGGDGNDYLTGGNQFEPEDAGIDWLYGGAGNDWLRGENMAGGAGDDYYEISNVTNTVAELTGEGVDTVWTLDASYTLGDNVENVISYIYQGSPITRTGNALDNTFYLRGDRGNSVIDGLGGVNTVSYRDMTSRVKVNLALTGAQITRPDPYDSQSTYYGTDDLRNIQNVEGSSANDLLTGNAQANRLWGGDGNDTLNGINGDNYLYGGRGNDNVYGGDGNDTYYWGQGDGSDSVSDSGGLDKLVFTNLNQVDVSIGTDTFGALLIQTHLSAESLYIGNGAKQGDESGWIEQIEFADHSTLDLANYIRQIYGSQNVTSNVTYTLGANELNLTLTGSADIDGTGNATDNTLTGNSGNNRLYGLGGTDTLIGGAGNDTLDGDLGVDFMTGGMGDDTYVVDDGDTVTESAGEGTDLVLSSVTYSLGNNVENLTLTGAAAINGTGNAMDNVLTGNSAANVLKGGTGNDTYYVDNASDVTTEAASAGTDTVVSSINWTLATNLENLTLSGSANINATGNTAANVLTGNAGNNLLSGGTGADTMIGGLGNDTYVVDNTADVVTEALNAGTDLVNSAATYTLSANVENLTLTGTTAIKGTGNALDNVLTGNSAVNVLTGGAGNDTYVVGTGDTTTEAAGAGNDTVKSSIAWTLATNVENLTLTGTSAVNGTGNTANNVLTGNSAINTLTGGAGNDTLDGKAVRTFWWGVPATTPTGWAVDTALTA